MELDKELEEIALALTEELKQTNPETEEYEMLLQRLARVQNALASETQRMNDTQRLELEKESNNIKCAEIIAEKKKPWWQVALEVLKGVVFVAANGAVILLGIRANNSGEVLPKIVDKVIKPKDLR